MERPSRFGAPPAPMPATSRPATSAMPTGTRLRSARRVSPQEEFAAVPSCPTLYAVIPHSLVQQPSSLVSPLSHHQHNMSISGSSSRPDTAPVGGSSNLGTHHGYSSSFGIPLGSPPEDRPFSNGLSPSPGLPDGGGTPGGGGGGVLVGPVLSQHGPVLSQHHVRAKSWDVHDLGRQMLAHQGQPVLTRLPLEGLSLAVECLVNSAMVTLEAAWRLDCTTSSQTLDCLFVLPMNHKGSVCGAEVVPADDRLLATAVIPTLEAEAAARATRGNPPAETPQQQPQQQQRSKTPPRSKFLSRVSSAASREGGSVQQGSPPTTPGKKGKATRLLFPKSSSVGGAPPFETSPEGSWVSTVRADDSVATPSSLGHHPSGSFGNMWVMGDESRPGSAGSARSLGEDFDMRSREGAGSEIGSGSGRLEGAGVGVAAAPAVVVDPRRKVEAETAAALLQEPEGFCPCMFRLRIPKVAGGGLVRVRLTYVESMALRGGYYEINIPLTIPADCLPPNAALHEIVKVSCMINSGVPKPMKIGDFNHPMKVMFVELGKATFVGYPSANEQETWPNADFSASYQTVSEETHAGVLVQAPLTMDRDSRATFCLTLCPPDPANMPVLPRSVVFIIDSEAAMRSKQMDDVRRAIASALKRFTPNDSFAVVAFDYELLTFSDALEPATPETIKRACKFVMQAHDEDEDSSLTAGNVLSPLIRALRLLRAQSHGVPQIVLVTDGSVADERRICQVVHEELVDWPSPSPRIFAFGVGPHCNYYFLKSLSSVTRGFTDVAYNLEDVRKRLDRLLQAIARPVVTDINVKDVPSGCEIFPFPIPDLHIAAPVVVSGKMAPVEDSSDPMGEIGLPLHLNLRGVKADGAVWRYKAQLTDAGNVPLNSVGVKEQMDILTADGWLQQDKSLEHMVASTSVAASVPCEHTRMLLFETTPALFEDFQQHRVEGVREDIRRYIDPRSPFVQVVPGLCLGFGKSPPAGIAVGSGSSSAGAPLAATATTSAAGESGRKFRDRSLSPLSLSRRSTDVHRRSRSSTYTDDYDTGSFGGLKSPTRGGILSSVMSCVRPRTGADSEDYL